MCDVQQAISKDLEICEPTGAVPVRESGRAACSNYGHPFVVFWVNMYAVYHSVGLDRISSAKLTSHLSADENKTDVILLDTKLLVVLAGIEDL
jgi:hypothetical protein